MITQTGISEHDTIRAYTFSNNSSGLKGGSGSSVKGGESILLGRGCW